MESVEHAVGEVALKIDTPEARESEKALALLADDVMFGHRHPGALSGRSRERQRDRLEGEKARLEDALARVERDLPTDELPLRRTSHLYLKSVTVRLVLPKHHAVRTWRARQGHAWTEKGIAALLDKLASNLERDFPGVDFRLVEVRKNQQFSIIHPAAEKRPDVKARKESENCARRLNSGSR